VTARITKTSLPILGLLSLSLMQASELGPARRGSPTPDPEASLYSQSASQLLQHDFQGREVSFLLLDAHTGSLLSSKWNDPDKPIPLGSLLKPFIAVAYGEAHQFRFPVQVCKGEAGGCWLPRGHGEIGLSAAVANSCNSYFRMLTARMNGADAAPVAAAFGLDPPSPDFSGPELIGVGNHWLISPLRMARAYVELNRRRDQLGTSEVVAGMAESARQGTGSEIDRALKYSTALVKTGTASCTHASRAPGDGFVVALFPAERPELLLMVRVHGVPGAKAAVTAGQMLRRLQE
jgi:hypothetical protein